ncbi:o-succinylbenzoate synthase [Dyadobacter sandarakinus]|uniref:O-succinylbenzoate synthase n=1 Tax=Dyadobacter sandarakinus TaxID=2747268 RepID=A0ABX7I0W3_9BACT|nr:o-succinylbenzoate synthase [Dyadobacter sandarakinus]QRQ99688.1 o-succinylbenzoate synthase [Dyadobacter sandarakinus]
MSLKFVFKPHTLQFKQEAGTSRGILTQKQAWVLKVSDDEQPGIYGFGECGPLPGLSVDDVADFEMQLASVCDTFNDLDLEVFPFNLDIILDQLVPPHLPSVRFGMETALLDYMQGGRRILYDTDFSLHGKGILMNGLIWMGSFENMQAQVEAKLQQGFSTLKMKVGAIDFDKECRILDSIRQRFGPDEITLRVDANGAFGQDEVFAKLEKLSQYALHSIEQPVKAGQHALMAEVCAGSPVPVALDEELIGIMDYREKFSLLKKLAPPFIILKPGLLGGFRHTSEWIEIAGRLGIDWWITSALESNIGLNAIAQFTARFENPLPQGLGTGQLYTNNFDSPLKVSQGHLFYNTAQEWALPEFN